MVRNSSYGLHVQNCDGMFDNKTVLATRVQCRTVVLGPSDHKGALLPPP
jgi:hypothetical protein